MNAFVLKAPHITEKTYRLVATRNEYTFIVAHNATKGQIKEAIEETFGVKVLTVHTTMVAGKTKRTGKRRTGVVQPDKKKAIVRLAEGNKISLFDIEQAPAVEAQTEQK